MSKLDELGKVNGVFKKHSGTFSYYQRQEITNNLVCCVSVQWTKHWFVLCDTSLRYYRDSEAKEVRLDIKYGTDFEVNRKVGVCIHCFCNIQHYCY